MWILDSKKNSDKEGHVKALNDMKAMFSQIKHNESVDFMKEEMKPIVAYFESLLPKYADPKEKCIEK